MTKFRETPYFSRGSFVLQFIVLIVAVVLEFAFSKSNFSELFVPGEYLALQRSLQSSGSGDTEIVIVDSSGVVLSSELGYGFDKLLRLLDAINADDPKAIVLDIDLSESLEDPYTEHQTKFFGELSRRPELLKRLVFGVSRGIGRRPSPFEPHLNEVLFGSTKVLEKFDELGYVKSYSVEQNIQSEFGGSSKVPFVWNVTGELVGQKSLLSPRVGVVQVVESYESGTDKTALINYGKVDSFIASSVKSDEIASQNFNEKIVVIGDLTSPSDRDRISIPGVNIQSGVLGLASILHSRLEAPLKFVPHQLEILVSFMSGVGLIILKAVIIFGIAIFTKTAPAKFSPSLKVDAALTIGTILLIWWFYTIYMVSQLVLFPGFLTSIFFALVEFPATILIKGEVEK